MRWNHQPALSSSKACFPSLLAAAIGWRRPFFHHRSVAALLTEEAPVLERAQLVVQLVLPPPAGELPGCPRATARSSQCSQ